MKRKLNNQRKSFKRQLTTKLSETADNGAFRPTAKMAAYWFTRLNSLLFNGRLGRVYITVKKLHHDWGRCVVDWDNRKTPKGKFNIENLKLNTGLKMLLICKIQLLVNFDLIS